MEEAIERLRIYIEKLHAYHRKPLYLFVDERHRLLSASGPSAHYGFAGAKTGQDLSEQLLYLVGMESSDTPRLTLPYLQLDDGLSAEVHAIRIKGGWGLAYVDTSTQMRERQYYQQMAHDLSLAQDEQQRLHGALQRAHAQLEQRKQALEQANRLKTQFIGRMSHQFRTPLASIVGFSELANEAIDEPARIQEHLRAIARSGNYLLNLVDNLLDHAVADQRQLNIRPSACDPAGLVLGLDELFQPVARQKGLSLNWWMGPGLPSRVWLDELRLRQVMVNLVDNAIRYTAEGAVTVSLEWEDDQLSVIVEDSGPGIPEGRIERLFAPFQQDQGNSVGKDVQGAGLGLSISREIVKQMGGELTLESRPGQGTRVEARLPAGARMQPGESPYEFAGVKVLVFDPDRDSLQLLQIYLGGAGCEVAIAQDQDECRQLAGEFGPQLILLGLHDPQGDRQLARRLRKQGYSGILAAIGSREHRQAYQALLDAGYSDLIIRPFTRASLLGQVGTFMSLGGG